MTESLENIITKGFHSWTRNLNVCVPLIINYIVQIIILISAVFFGMLMLLGESLAEVDSMPEDQLFNVIYASFKENVYSIVIFILLLYIILLLFNSYFLAGAVGMSKNAISRGDTNISDMVNAAGKNFSNVLLATFMITLIGLAGIISLVPGAVLVRNNMDIPESGQFLTGLLLLTFGLIIWLLYMLIVQMIFSTAITAIVVEEVGALEGLTAGYRFFIENMGSVITLFCITDIIAPLVAGVTFYFITLIISFAGNEILNNLWSLGNQLILLTTLQPITLIWWTRLYMVRTGKNIYIEQLLADPWG